MATENMNMDNFLSNMGGGNAMGKNKGAPQRVYLFEVLLPPDLDSNRLISTRVLGVSTPFTRFESSPTNVGNSKWYYALENDIGNITMQVIESEDGKTEKFFKDWMALMLSDKSKGAFNPPAKYKRNISVYLLNTQGQRIKEIKYFGYFPLGIADSQFNYDNNEATIWDVEFSGDDISTEEINAPPIAIKIPVIKTPSYAKRIIPAEKPQTFLQRTGKVLGKIRQVENIISETQGVLRQLGIPVKPIPTPKALKNAYEIQAKAEATARSVQHLKDIIRRRPFR